MLFNSRKHFKPHVKAFLKLFQALMTSDSPGIVLFMNDTLTSQLDLFLWLALSSRYGKWFLLKESGKFWESKQSLIQFMTGIRKYLSLLE